MTLQNLINNYGYIAILIGTFLEGETILVLGGIAAKLDYLELHWVIVSAFTGTLLGDQLFFFLGRYRGRAFLDKRPTWQSRANKVHRIMGRHHITIILGFRFLYGLRSVTPFVIGMSRISIAEFLILNIIGAAIWAVVIGMLGYVFGHGLELIMGDIKRYEKEIMTTVLAAGTLVWLIKLISNKRQAALSSGGKEK